MNNLITFAPIITLIIILFTNILLFDSTMNGPNQIALLIAAFLGSLIALKSGKSIQQILKGITTSINSSMNAIIILLIIGGLTSTWILSGAVPAMIYYGIELINPKYFLLSSCIICAIVSVSTGSSWTTAATIGIALMSIGELLGLDRGLTAGAIISGAYFGDKMSPLSETTNLAPSVSGSNLIDHIKYMTRTTIPTITITLIIFFLIGINYNSPNISTNETNTFLEAIDSTFYIGWEVFTLPLIIIILIYFRVSAKKTLFIGLLSGIFIAVIFQHELIMEINSNTKSSTLTTLIKTVFTGTNIQIAHESVTSLLSKGGVIGMMWIVILVITAMIFGGVMYAGGFLKKITDLILSKSSSNLKIIQSTAGSCLFFNITTCDQYLAIVIPGRMFKEIYAEHNLHSTNLSRTIEDTGTVTSVLVPWNSCAAYHSEILAINPIAYLPYCFFNIISPCMTLLFAYFNIRIKKLK